jgi:hypothetical protein
MCRPTTYRAASHCCIPLIPNELSLFFLLAGSLEMLVPVVNVEMEPSRCRPGSETYLEFIQTTCPKTYTHQSIADAP